MQERLPLRRPIRASFSPPLPLALSLAFFLSPCPALPGRRDTKVAGRITAAGYLASSLLCPPSPERQSPRPHPGLHVWRAGLWNPWQATAPSLHWARGLNFPDVLICLFSFPVGGRREGRREGRGNGGGGKGREGALLCGTNGAVSVRLHFPRPLAPASFASVESQGKRLEGGRRGGEQGGRRMGVPILSGQLIFNTGRGGEGVWRAGASSRRPPPALCSRETKSGWAA